MSKIFTIQITPIKAPFMRCRQDAVPTVTKARVNNKVVYHEFRWNNPKCGRNIKFMDNADSIEEREQYKESFRRRVQRAFEKANIRFFKHYEGINFEDEIVRVYAPYPHLAPNATITVYSQRVHEYNAHRDFLRDIVAKMNNQYNTLMCVLQQGKYDLAKDSLYKLNKYMFDLQSMCRPHHHEVVFKGDKNPLTANLR
jgi:hypothetical protein